MPPSYGTGRRGVAIFPLALILGLHLVLLLWGTSEHGHADDAKHAEQRHFTLVWLPPLKPRAMPPPTRAPEASALAARAPAAIAASVPRLRSSTVAPPVSIPADMPPSSKSPPFGAPDAPELLSMLDAAKRQAGALDRELREGKPAPLAAKPDHPMARFRDVVESAYIDRSRTMLVEVLTQPDGVIVYRFRRGGKVRCRQSGGSGPIMLERSEGAKLAGAGSTGGAGAAGDIQCPGGDAAWKPL